MRYFAAPVAVAAAIRQGLMEALGQPNGQADAPWPVDGDFLANGTVYVAIGPHHTEGEFWGPMIDAALDQGVQEISKAEYLAAKPAE
jgi:hypothetical protein